MYSDISHSKVCDMICVYWVLTCVSVIKEITLYFVYVNTMALGESSCIWSLFLGKLLSSVEELSFSAAVLCMRTVKLWDLHIVESAPTFLASHLTFYVNIEISVYYSEGLQQLAIPVWFRRILVEFVHLLQDKIKIIKVFPFFHFTSNTLL